MPVSSTKIETGALLPVLGRHGLLAGGDEQDLEAVDVALGDAVRRVERERGLVVLARGGELAELPERLRQAVLRLGVRAELEELAVRRGGVGPLRGRGLGDGLVGQLALRAREVDGALVLGLDVGEGHVGGLRFGARDERRPSSRAWRAAGTGHCAGIAF